MAKEKKEKEEASPIDDETVEMLDSQVKKGKARKFFLIYKGSQIKTLVVFKKGPFGPKILKAKKNGFKGDVSYGVVTGSGKNLFFQFPGNGQVAASMKVDSWEEEPPVKKTKLRQFLIDNELSYKPSLHIITEVANAPNPDSESGIPSPPPPPGTEAGNDELQAGTSASTSQETTATSAPPEPPEADAAAESSASETDARHALGQIKVEIDLLVKHKLDEGGRLKSGLATAASSVKGQAYDAAVAACDELGQALKGKWDQSLSGVLPRVKALLSTPFAEQRGDVDKIRATLGFARERAQSMRFGGAIVSLDRLSNLLDTAENQATSREADVIPAGIVTEMKEKLTKARVRWGQAITDAKKELQKVQVNIKEEDPELSSALDEIVESYQADLDGLLANVDKIQDGKLVEQTCEQALETINSLDEEIGGDDVLAYLDEYDLANVNLSTTFTAAFQELRQEIESARVAS